jgi:hypothetical protein
VPLRIETPYLSLLESLLRWFESRGESASSARYGASIAIAALLTMNIVTLTLFAYGLSGARWFRIFQNIPLNILGVFALVALHWHLIGRIQRGGVRTDHAASGSKARTSVPLWLGYLVTSITLLFVGVLIAVQK